MGARPAAFLLRRRQSQQWRGAAQNSSNRKGWLNRGSQVVGQDEDRRQDRRSWALWALNQALIPLLSPFKSPKRT